MSRIDFYLLKGAHPNGKLVFVARLVAKIHRLGKRIYIHALNEAQAKTLDDLLWTVDQSSFIPHALSPEAAATDAMVRVVIDTRPPCDFSYDVLISLLEDEIPDYWQEFQRVAEVVSTDAEDKQRARRRFRRYRESGCDVDTHEVPL